MPEPVPVDSTVARMPGLARMNSSATAVVNGYTVEEPTIRTSLAEPPPEPDPPELEPQAATSATSGSARIILVMVSPCTRSNGNALAASLVSHVTRLLRLYDSRSAGCRQAN